MPTIPKITSVIGEGYASAAITGTADPNSTIALYADGTLVATVTASSTGAWSDPSVAQAPNYAGTISIYTYTATATDAAGHTSAPSAGIAAPTITDISPDLGISATDGITANGHVTLSGTAPANDVVYYFDNGSQLGSVTATASGSWTTPSFYLQQGTNAFMAVAADATGNVSAMANFTAVLEATAPPAPVIAGISPDSGVSATDGITRLAPITVSGTAQASSIVYVYDNSVLVSTITANAAGAWTSGTITLTPGSNVLYVDAANTGGAVGPGASFTAVLVPTPPAPVISGISPDTGGSATDGITNAAAVTVSGTATANDTVSVYNAGQLVATATANSAGAWTSGTITLASGTNTLTAITSDLAGNVSASSASYKAVLQTTPPNAPVITSVAGEFTNAATISGTAAANAIVTVYANGTRVATVTANASGAWATGTLAQLPNAYAYTATATDIAGNVSAASATPAAPAITGISPDTGASPHDGITNATAVTILGTATRNSTVYLADNGALIGSTTANAAGAWTSGTITLANASNLLQAIDIGANGNASASASYTAVLQTTPPQAPVITGVSPDTGISATDGITNIARVTVSGTAAPGSTITIYNTGGYQASQVTADASGNWTSGTITLSGGSNTLTATATDIAGNVSSAGSYIATLLTSIAAPAITGISPHTPGQSNANYTSTAAVTVSGTAEANSSINLYDGGTLVSTAATSSAGSWTSGTITLANGSNNLTATAADAAGNVSSTGSFTAVLETMAAPPVITGISPDTGLSATDGITDTAKVTLSGTAAAKDLIKLYSGTTQISEATATASGAWTTGTITLATGANNWTATATDPVGNVSNAVSYTAVLDTTVPAVPVITSVLGEGTGSVTVSGTAAANCAITVYADGTAVATVMSNSAGAWSTGSLAQSPGFDSFTATATEIAGNVSAASTVPAAPAITGMSPDTGSSATDGITNAAAVTVSGTAPANSLVEIADNGALVGNATASATGAWTSGTITLTNGSNALLAGVVNNAGNYSGLAATTAVLDTTPPGAPVITGISPDTGISSSDGITDIATVTVSGTGPANDIIKLYDGAALVATVTANAAGAWASGTITLANGGNTLTATATDIAGNTGSAGSDLVQLDTTVPAAPVITGISPDTGSNNTDGITDAAAVTVSGTAAANSTVALYDGGRQISTVSANSAGAWTSGTFTLAAGSNALTATATDTAGNVSTTGRYTAVLDTIGPQITGLSATAGAYKAGSTITLALNFNEAVTVAGGTPTLALSNGETATYAAGSGSPTLDFTYTVASGDDTSSLTLAASNALVLHGATIAANADGLAATTSQANSLALGGTISIITTTPSTPSISGISPDTGNSATDGITSTAAVTVSGTSPANDTIQLYDAGTLVSTATANASGAWTSGTITLASGSNAITATATDAAGNVSSAGSYTAVLDTIGPQITSLSGTAGAYKAGSTITLALNFNEAVTVAGGTPTLALSNGKTATYASGSGTATLNFTYTVASGDDTSSLTLAASNALAIHGAGITASADGLAATTSQANGLAPSGTISIITTTLSTPSISGISPDTGTSSTDGITKSAAVTVSGTGPANDTIQLYDAGTLVSTVTANSSGAWTSGTITLASGSNALTATATDIAGNTSHAGSFTAVLDTTAPAAPFVTGISPDTGSSSSDGITSAAKVTVSGKAAAFSTISLYEGTMVAIAATNGSGAPTGGAPLPPRAPQPFIGTLVSTVTANASGAWTSGTITLANGVNTLTATATDIAGNTSITDSYTAVLDATPPAAPVITSISPDTGSSNTDGITTASQVTVSGTGPANDTIALYDAGTLVSTARADGSGNWTSATITLSAGNNVLTATATDIAGNVSAAGSYTAVLELVTHAVTAPRDGMVTIANIDPDGGGTWSVDLSDSTTSPDLVHASQFDPAGNTGTSDQLAICFMPDTRIATALGDVPVQHLRIGDIVRRADGGPGKVRWIGRQTISPSANRLYNLPIRIRAGALGEGLPLRDLFVSPEHALLLDGVLVQAGALVNGRDITRCFDITHGFTYYHIELADHALLLAEGVAAESFVDNVTRRNFDNWDEHAALYGTSGCIREMHLPRAKSLRQLPTVLRRRLADRLVRAA